jgi:pyruvate carboxylase
MKMETTVTASEDAVVKRVVLEGGILVEADDLVLTLG